MASSRVNVAIIGVGLVGTEVIAQLTTPRLSNLFDIVALQNSKKTLLLDQSSSLKSNDDWKGKLAASSTSAMTLKDLTLHLSKLENHTVVVDNTSNEDVAGFYPSFLKAGLSVVTPNKKATSSSLTLYKQIVEAASPNPSMPDRKPPLYYGESTVGAGLPLLSTLKDLIETGDEVYKIEGVFSGTLSYIFNEWSAVQGDDKKFSDVVKVAKDNGYTEPHPGDDLSGSDVSRKLTILSRLVPSLVDSLPKGFESVATHNLTPVPLQDITDGNEYIRKLPDFDADYDKLNKEAKSQNCVLRYVGVIDVKKREIKASLEKYPTDHPFATALGGSDNIVSFTTKRYPQRPLLVQGSGAGAAVTAMGVVSDLIKVAERRSGCKPFGTEGQQRV